MVTATYDMTGLSFNVVEEKAPFEAAYGIAEVQIKVLIFMDTSEGVIRRYQLPMQPPPGVVVADDKKTPWEAFMEMAGVEPKSKVEVATRMPDLPPPGKR
jgi:hypothetical protein